MNSETALKVSLPCQAIWTSTRGRYSFILFLKGYDESVSNFSGEIIHILEQADDDDREKGYYSDGWNASAIREILG